MTNKGEITPPQCDYDRIFARVNLCAVCQCSRQLPRRHRQTLRRWHAASLPTQLPSPPGYQPRGQYQRHGPNPLQSWPQVGKHKPSVRPRRWRTQGLQPLNLDQQQQRRPPTPKIKWSRKLDFQAAIQTAKRVGNKFVLSCVEETWVVCLKTRNHPL